jgi:ribosomal-protein-alanine N-acetyltransferase
MTRADLDEVLAIERVSFVTPWSRGAFLYELERNRVARCWVTRREGEGGQRVLGYLCVWEIGVELHITNLAVHPEARRQGIAGALLSGMIDDARRRGITLVFLEVRPTNVEALGLYERLGFRIVGRRRGYYFDTGEDALVMEANLTAAPAGNQSTG